MDKATATYVPLRREALERVHDWKVRMERKYLREAAAGEDRHAAEVRAIMNRDKQSKIS